MLIYIFKILIIIFYLTIESNNYIQLIIKHYNL